MQAFSKCKRYEDYLDIIRDSLINGIKHNDSNDSGYPSLIVVKDSKIQSKLMEVISIIDKELSYGGSRDNEMWKKLDYILALGIYSHEYSDFFSDLSSSSLFTLIIGEFSYFNEYNKDYVSLLSNQELLSVINDNYKEKQTKSDYDLFTINDYFFMIHEHFDKNPFDLNDDEKCDEFRKEMINKIKSNTLHQGVMDMIEYWNSNEEIREMVLGGKKK